MGRSYKIAKYTEDRHPVPHLHENYELFISLSDEGTLFIQNQGYSLHFGTIVVISPFESHRCSCHDHDRYVIHFTQEDLRRLSTPETDFTKIFERGRMVRQIEDNAFVEILQQLIALEKPETAGFGNDVEQRLRFDSLLLLLARAINAAGPEESLLISHEKRVIPILRYIHQNYSSDITLDTLSSTFFISKSRLCQIFKDATGSSIGDYIITYRLKQACALLQEGIAVQDVSEMVGFHTSTHFIRMFKQRTGSPPGQFARNSRNWDAVSA